MPSVKRDSTIKEYQNFTKEVYGLPNDRQFSAWEMLSNVQRFLTRGLKGIRKKDNDKSKINFLISFSWLVSLMNQLRIDLEDEIWKRFPYLCSHCRNCPCVCKEKHITERHQNILRNEAKRPKTLTEFQNMFEKIYPSKKRTTEHAGIHLAEELGELSEAMLVYHGSHQNEDFEKIPLEAADVFSLYMDVFNSLKINMANELSGLFYDNCHVCHKAPCQCAFTFITKFES